ncbi:3-oxoacyl-[acyl-carrier-protein] reductase [Laceyella tengchongensis]|jgi:3-oxoacyl-[acyl-carrier protein] reductase|uniref:3-oxoacyl-[acyl-carrier-protein] reductase n=1 Tax=Laceyella tengchongensis TaxID=574699 RepID=A0AA46ADY9_9BACL|nr:3-oxoacyl-[acyl-carrier-protein] reductase [Laceyella tengchongensis]MRG29074.1 3-oxoacyl-[acyl-carrier-protein] reductase [Laceyella tengchongensis]SMP09926.1 3-oxoacyl-[acyl-carrier-protein] reductase [Laceyella tengchongensis]
MLNGKTAVVTGGSRGIGRAIAITLAEAGADIVIFYAGNHAAAEETIQSVRETGRQGLALKVDVSDKEQVDAALKEVVSTFGRVDILVNNAGITRDNLLMRMKEDEWDQVIATNLKGAFLCTKAVIRPMLKQKGGRIINISSVVGVAGNPGQANYVAAKAGLIGLTKTTAKELASRGITVNAIAPGFIETDMTSVLDEALKEQMRSEIPLGYYGTPQDIAEAVKFLASDSGRYITGQTIHVDGGMVMN